MVSRDLIRDDTVSGPASEWSPIIPPAHTDPALTSDGDGLFRRVDGRDAGAANCDNHIIQTDLGSLCLPHLHSDKKPGGSQIFFYIF